MGDIPVRQECCISVMAHCFAVSGGGVAACTTGFVYLQISATVFACRASAANSVRSATHPRVLNMCVCVCDEVGERVFLIKPYSLWQVDGVKRMSCLPHKREEPQLLQHVLLLQQFFFLHSHKNILVFTF